jgi:UMF1 family MFS transporter
MMSRAAVAWMLYDFANSAYVAVVPATIYAAYYANVVVGNQGGEGDFWWGLSVTTAMVLVALLSPPLGAIVDRSGARKRCLGVLTYLSVGATLLMATVRPGDVAWGYALAVVGTVGFEAAIVAYNAYLPTLAPPDRLGRLSAYGFATGYAGSAIALAAALPFALHDRLPGAFLVAGLLFGVGALPAMRWLPADRPGVLSVRAATRAGLGETLATFREITRLQDLRRFLLAYLFYEDGVNTVVFFSSVFASRTLGFTFPELLGLYLVVQLSALGGAWLWARPTDVRGPRWVIAWTLVQWCLVVVAAYLVTSKTQFFVVAVFAGTGLGAVQAASRTLMARLIPAGREAAMFGFYALCGKTAAVIGPVIFGVVSRATGGNQRAAILAVGVMFVVGLALLRRIRSPGSGGGTSPRSGGRCTPSGSNTAPG